MIVVSDTSPLTNLAAIGRLDLLRQMYGSVLVPEAVYRELASDPDQPGAREVESEAWLVRGVVRSEQLLADLSNELHPGEAEALALAVEIAATLVLIDEKRGRRVASRLGLERIGLLGILLQAKQRGLVPEVKPLLDALRADAGFWVKESLYRRTLELAGEIA